MNNPAALALAHISQPFNAAEEFTVEDACKTRGWAKRRARAVLLGEVRGGRLSRRRITDGLRRYYAYSVIKEKNETPE